jgi:FkbM family methyltransferase
MAAMISRHFPEVLVFATSIENWRDFRVRRKDSAIWIFHDRTSRAIVIPRSISIYAADFIRCFDYYFCSVEPVEFFQRDERYNIVDFSRPRFHVVNGFDAFPVYCPSFIEPFVTAQQYIDFANLHPGDVVLDLGMYVGLTAIAFAEQVGESGMVVGVEPDPVSFAAAQCNIDRYVNLRGHDNIRTVPMAVSGSCGDLIFRAEGAMGSSAQEMIGSHRGLTYKVDALTLDALSDLLALKKVDFIKMDIEGSELGVLRGAGNFFGRYRPRKIIVEPHSVIGVRSDEDVRSILTEYGYNCETIAQVGVSSLPLITGTIVGS